MLINCILELVHRILMGLYRKIQMNSLDKSKINMRLSNKRIMNQKIMNKQKTEPKKHQVNFQLFNKARVTICLKHMKNSIKIMILRMIRTIFIFPSWLELTLQKVIKNQKANSLISTTSAHTLGKIIAHKDSVWLESSKTNLCNFHLL